MLFLIGRLSLIGFIISLTSCADIKDIVGRPDTPLLYRHSSSDFIVAWNALETDNDTVIEGRITNVKNIQIHGIELKATVSNTAGNSLSEGAFLRESINLRMNDSVSFSVKLKDAKIAKGNVLEFKMRYQILTGGWGGRDAQSSFKVEAATGVAIEEKSEK